MAFDQFVGKQHTDAASCDLQIDGIISSEEAFEHFLLFIGRDSDSCICNSDEPMTFIFLSLHSDIAPLTGIFQGICHQVTDDGIHLISVQPYFLAFKISFKYYIYLSFASI